MSKASKDRIRPLRVVIEPALLLRALLATHGPAETLRRAWQREAIHPLITAPLMTALLQSLSYPALALSPDDRQELLADLLPHAEVVPPPTSLLIRSLAAPARALVELALATRADLILSDDPALHAWATARRSPHARELCAVRAISDWIQVLPPSHQAGLL